MNINGHWYTETEATAYIVTLENKVKKLEDKHLSECRQIALYDDELQQAWRQGFIEGKKEHDKRIIEIAKHYGVLLQREQFIEECSEAILAAQKSKRTPNLKTISDLQSEVADVLIMALQMRYLFGAEAVDRQVELKLARQIQRIKEEEI